MITPTSLPSRVLETGRLTFRLAILLVSCSALIGCAYAGPKLIGVAKADPEAAGKYERVTEVEARSALDITRHGRAVQTRASMNLELGDQVETGAVWALIRFPNGHEVYLHPRTRVRLGSIFAFFGELFVRARGQFSVETEFITLGVQGTEFWIKVDESQNSAVGVLDGSVVMNSRHGSWNPISLTRNDVMTISRDQLPRAQKESERELARVRRTMAQVDEALRAQPLPPPSVCPGGPDCPPCPVTQPGCPGYAPPCPSTQVGCPGYAPPCPATQPGCPGYAPACSATQPGCPGYTPPCSATQPGCPGYTSPQPAPSIN